MRHCLLQTNVKRSREAKSCFLRDATLGFYRVSPMSAMSSFAVRFIYSVFLAYYNRISGALPVERPSLVWAEREFKLAPRVPIRGATILRRQDRSQCASLGTRVFESSPQVALMQTATWNCLWQTSKWIRLPITPIVVGYMSD